MLDWRYTPYALPLLAAALTTAALAGYGWRQRRAVGGLPFSALMLSVTVWIVGALLEMGAPTLEGKFFWTRVQYGGIVAIPVAWLVLALHYSERGAWLTRRTWALLLAGPLLTLVIIWTNESHHLFWRSLSLVPASPLAYLSPVRGPWFWVHTALSYGYLLTGTLLLTQRLLRAPSLYRGQSRILLLGVYAPWLGNILHLAGYQPVPGLDATTLAFTITGLAAAWGLFRYRLLDIAPVARGAVFEGMRDAVLVLDPQQRVVDLNPAAQQILGQSATALLGQPLRALFPAQAAYFKRLPPARKQVEEITLGDDSDPHIFEMTLSPLPVPGSQQVGCLVVLHDVSDHKHAEQTAREALEFRQKVMESTTNAIYALDLEGRFTLVNRRTTDLTGYWADELVGEPMAKLFDAERLPALTDLLAEAGQWGRAVSEYETEVIRRDGSPVTVSLSLAPLLRGAALVGIVGSAEDITQRKHAEQRLRETVAQVQELERLKVEFLANMSHELRTPLNAIIGFSTLLLKGIDGPLTELQTHDLGVIHNSSKRLLTLIDDVLDLARIVAGRMELELGSVAMEEVVADVIAAIAPRAAERGLTVEAPSIATLPLVRADRARLRQVLLNLASNAVKFTEQGTICFTLRSVATAYPNGTGKPADAPNGPFVEVAVRDTGIGIPAEEQVTIFEAFRQVDGSATRRVGGSGLGLALASRLVAMQGGALWVESAVGVGSTFRFTLPIAPPDAVALLPEGAGHSTEQDGAN